MARQEAAVITEEVACKIPHSHTNASVITFKSSGTASMSTCVLSGSEPCSGSEASMPMSDMFRVEYPADLVVRSTFLDLGCGQTDASPLRRVQSAPSTPQHRRQELDERAFERAALDIEGCLRGVNVAQEALKPPAACGASSSAPVLELSSLIAGPVLGSPELPTVGSAEHATGGCKPCAFVWKGNGCTNGVNCIFCHLCDPSEKKRRQKEKKAVIRSQRCYGGFARM